MSTTTKTFASQADLEEKKVSFTRLSEHAWAYTAEGDPNTGIVIGDDAVLVADTQATPAMAADVIRRIREVTDKPIKYVETWTTPVKTVGDPTRSVCSDCGQGVPHFSGVTGPFVKGKVCSSRSKGHWFDQIGCIRLDRCRIEFMDGSVQEFAGESLRRLEASTFEACPPGR